MQYTYKDNEDCNISQVELNLIQQPINPLDLQGNFKEKEEEEEKEKFKNIGQIIQVNLNQSNFNVNLPLKSAFHKIPVVENEELQFHLQYIQKFLQNNVQKWDVPSVNEWRNYNDDKNIHQFSLPETVFTDDIKNKIEFQELQFDVEQLEVEGLNGQQMGQIYKNGTFEVKSSKFSFPYVWQLSPYVVRGYDNRYKSLCFDFSLSYRNWVWMWQKIIKNGRKDSLKNLLKFQPQLVSGIKQLFIFPFYVFNIIFGMPGLYIGNITRNLEREMEIIRQKQIFDKYTQDQLDLELCKRFMAHKNDQRNQLIKEVKELQNEINNKTTQRRIILESTLDQDDPDYYIKIQAESYLIQEQTIMQFNKFDQPLKESIIRYVKALDIIFKNIDIQETKKIDKRQLYLDQVKLKYPFRARYLTWKNQVVQDMLDKDNIYETEQRNNEIFHQLEHNNLISQRNIYQDYINFQSVKPTKQLIGQVEKAQQYPSVEINLNIRCYPPYKVIKTDLNNGKFSYHLQKWRKIKINTIQPFWRIKIFVYRWFIYTNNITFILYQNSVTGFLGIKRLTSCGVYEHNRSIHHDTGQLLHQNTRRTVFYLLGSVMRGIMKSRNNFEAQPDTGFFGKSISRLFNLFECYVFRLLFIGAFVLVCMPPIVIIHSMVSFLLSLTTFIWMPLALIIRQLFQYFIYDFDLSNNADRWPYFRYCIWFPMIQTCFKLAVRGLFQIFFSIFLFIVHFFLIFFFFFWGLLRYLTRTTYDVCMFIVVKFCARVPTSETSMAWRVSGPGVGRQFYYTLEENEIYILIRATLESIQLDYYQTTMISKIDQTLTNSKMQVERILNPLYSNYKDFNNISKTNELLKQILNRQIQARRNFFPTCRNNKVRFTENELSQYIVTTTKMIKAFVEDQQMDYIWAKLEVMNGNWNRLNQFIWKRTFNDQVLEPIEEMEVRFQMKKKNKNNQFVIQVQNILKGSGDLDVQNRIPVVKKKIILHKKSSQFVTVQKVFDISDSISLNPDKANYQQSIFPNYYIYKRITEDSRGDENKINLVID